MAEPTSSHEERLKNYPVKITASPMFLTLAILCSVQLLICCLLAVLLAFDQPPDEILLSFLPLLIQILVCAGLWTLVSRGRSGQLSGAGFRLVWLGPFLRGIAGQLLVAAVLVWTVWVWFPSLSAEIRVYQDDSPAMLMGILAQYLLLIAACAELLCLGQFQLARYMRRLGRNGRDGHSSQGLPLCGGHMFHFGHAYGNHRLSVPVFPSFLPSDGGIGRCDAHVPARFRLASHRRRVYLLHRHRAPSRPEPGRRVAAPTAAAGLLAAHPPAAGHA